MHLRTPPHNHMQHSVWCDSDGMWNGEELGIDCGGHCPVCPQQGFPGWAIATIALSSVALISTIVLLLVLRRKNKACWKPLLKPEFEESEEGEDGSDTLQQVLGHNQVLSATVSKHRLKKAQEIAEQHRKEIQELLDAGVIRSKKAGKKSRSSKVLPFASLPLEDENPHETARRVPNLEGEGVSEPSKSGSNSISSTKETPGTSVQHEMAEGLHGSTLQPLPPLAAAGVQGYEGSDAKAMGSTLTPMRDHGTHQTLPLELAPPGPHQASASNSIIDIDSLLAHQPMEEHQTNKDQPTNLLPSLPKGRSKRHRARRKRKQANGRNYRTIVTTGTKFENGNEF